jgi:saccharopine dehydrogenase-like NADP-dependent oxidoreductase
MKKILVLGAGRSSGALINYLLTNAVRHEWSIGIGDLDEAAAIGKVGSSPHAKAMYFNIEDDVSSTASVAWADVVISLLPPAYHTRVAKHCLIARKHLLTASYVSDEMQSFHQDAIDKNLLLLNECGLDPGIDHMSAMQIIDRIRSEGGVVTSFESFTGGLIAPDTDPGNPWRYKFTWNPRNVVMAGQGTAKYLEGGAFKYIPYQQLFRRVTKIQVNGIPYEGYANRDSLKYRETYRLHDISTMIRGTLRNEGFCEAWNVFVQLGCCDDTYRIDHAAGMTHRDFLACFLPGGADVEREIIQYLNVSKGAIEKLRWLGLFNDEPIGLSVGTPAQILEHILQKRWKLHANDNDMIVMWHRFRYTTAGKSKEVQASLNIRGTNLELTAMSRTVGLPLGIAAKLLLEGKIRSRGVMIPVHPEFYDPILHELKEEGIEMTERHL